MRSLKRILYNYVLDVKFGGKFLGGSISSKYKDIGAVDTQNTDYKRLEYIFSKFELKDTDIFVDIGCGKGRVMNWLLHIGFKGKIIGVELDPDVAAFTKNRLRKYDSVHIIQGNVLDCDLSEATVCYLFNPFDEKMLGGFLDQMEAYQNSVTLIYYNDVHKSQMECRSQWLLKDEFELKANGFGHHGSVWKWTKEH